MTADELIIIGAGPAGLALSHAAPGGARILERSGEVGGLCRSIQFGGGVFDIGGHSFHSPYPEVLSLVEQLMAGRWHAQRRDARVSFMGELIDYPFQQHFDQISRPDIVAECRESLPAAGVTAGAENFEDWIVKRFGTGVARHFMLPYNRKLWARDLKRMSCEWVGERVAGAAPDTAATAGPARHPLRSESQVGYPADGGFGAIFEAMAKGCGPIEFNQKVIAIDPVARTVHAAGGAAWRWGRLVSTMPLPALLRTIADCPAALIAAADLLEHVSLKVLMILVAHPPGAAPHRVYVADGQAPPHKVAFNHTSSPSLRQRPAQAIMCEIAYAPENPLAPDAELERATVDWLVDSSLIAGRGDVAETRIVDVEYGYPVYTHTRAAIVERIRAWLEPRGIASIGRFGAWEYLNSDACIHQGVRLAERLG